MLSHSSGALLALVGLVALLHRAARHGLALRQRLSLVVYASALVFTFAASSLFHFFTWSPDELVFFKKLDHASIFILIAGTCTVLLNAGRMRHRDVLIGASWFACAGGLVLKMVFWPMALWMTAAVYLTVGWIAAASVLNALRDVAWSDMRILVYGMVVHSAAAFVFAAEAPVVWRGVIEGHELFHVMVLAGTAMHFTFVLRYCAVAPSARPRRAEAETPAVSLAADPRGS